MAADQLHVTLIQADLIWEDKQANLIRLEELIGQAEGPLEVVVLPEMFSTGFSMNPETLAEPMEGTAVNWMINVAKKFRCILTGSLIIRENDKFYNRLVWVQPDGRIGCYDKKHLFGFARENDHYEAGNKRLIVSVNGWKICPLICYDLRFPVWSRNNAGWRTDEESAAVPSIQYDVLIYVANWPERRSLAWKTLLQARSIENQSFVVGVNRVGVDGKEISYSGDSAVYDPLGEVLWQQSGYEIVKTVRLSRQRLEETRTNLPFLKDADRFLLL